MMLYPSFVCRARCFLANILVVSSLALLPCVSHADTTITSQMRLEDPRLEKKITIQSPHLYVGELLEIVKDRTGVDVYASDKDGAAGEQVAIFVKDMPLGELMDGLWALMSRRGAYRRWERETNTGMPGAYHYRFVRPVEVDQYADKLKQDIQKDFDDYADAELKALDMSPDDLKAAAEKDPRLFTMSVTPHTRAGMRALADSLTPGQREQLLHGDRSFTLSVDQLPQSGKGFISLIRGEFERASPFWQNRQNDSISLMTTIAPGEMTPSLYILVQPYGGYAYVGGSPFERQWRANADDDWLLPGDERTDDAESKTVARPATAQSYDSRDIGRSEGRRLMQLAEAAAPMAILAQLPVRSVRSNEYDPREPYGRALGNFLQSMHDASLPHKWRHGALLISNYNWFNNADKKYLESQNVRLSWSRIKQWRADTKAAGGILPLADLCWAAHNMTKAERERYGFEEFPEIGQIDGKSGPMKDLLDYFGSHSPDYLAHLESTSGIALSLLPSSYVQMLTVIASNTPGGMPANDRITSLRATEVRAKEGAPPSLTLHIEALGRRGEPLCSYDEWLAGALPAPKTPHRGGPAGGGFQGSFTLGAPATQGAAAPNPAPQ